MGASCRRLVITTAALVFCILASHINLVESTGTFEIRLHQLVVEEDGCCGLSSISFRICVTNYQVFVNFDSPCIIGEAVTRPYGKDELQALNESISFPFNFTWLGSFTFLTEVYRKSETSGERMLLSRFVARRNLSAKQNWQIDHFTSAGGQSLHLSYRIKCETNYFGDGCAIHCKPRDDNFGHYTCDPRDGRKICRPGWNGKYCETAICRQGCHEKHGFCKEPYECKCHHGWEGELCDICSPYPGCQHGTCSDPWQCNCNEGWGGLFCNEDLNYCTNHQPCKNGGTCTNTGQGSYTCSCLDSYMGKDCDVLQNPCTNNPCQNGGTCLNPSAGNYSCNCVLGFYGPNCETSASICTHNPCRNGGSCVHDPDGFVCACAPGFFGNHCENAASTCFSDICQNSGTCFQMPQGPLCQCPHGFIGAHCEKAISCASEPCLNGGKCFEGLTRFQCNCAAGFTGASCEVKISNCLPNPCNNGGTCYDLDAHYHCECRPGFSGRNCSSNDLCSSAPCHNGGLCKTEPFGFSCHCTEAYSGQFCESSVPHLKQILNNAISNVSHQVSDEPKDDRTNQMVLILVCSLVGTVVFITCAICLALKYCKLCRNKQSKQINEASEDELKQNERNTLQMNNKCVVPQNKIVNTLDRMPTKVNNDDLVKVVNAQMGNKKLPEKNLMYIQRTFERGEKSCISGNGGCHSSKDWAPCNSGGVYIIQEHIQPLKVEDCYHSRPPSLHLVDSDKIFATEV